MKKIFNFKEFINESSAAGNMDKTYKVPFAYSSHDPKLGYNSKSFVEDLRSIFVEKPELEKEITEFISTMMNMSLEDLEYRPFSEVSKIIPDIERIIEAGEYEPETVMPGGSLLFIRNKSMSNGSSADFYINRHGTKIEVVTEDEYGQERVYRFTSEKFPFDRFEFTDAEIEDLKKIIEEKEANS